MEKNTGLASVGCTLLLTVAATAQTPDHATELNPNLQMIEPTIVHDGDYVHAFGQGVAGVLYARSSDGGRTWPTREHTIANYGWVADSRYGITSGGNLIVASCDKDSGPSVIYSDTSGASWSTPVALDSNWLPQTEHNSMSMCITGTTVLVVWTDDAQGGSLWSNRSTDNGLTWQANKTRFNPTLVGSSTTPICAQSGSTIHVTWRHTTLAGFGTNAVQRSVDNGQTWLASPILTPFAFMKLTSDGTNLHAMGQFGQLYQSNDSGDTWTSPTVPGITNFNDVATDGTLTVVSGMSGPSSAYTFSINVSADGGQTWQSNPLQLPAPGFLQSKVFLDSGNVYANFGGLPSLGVMTSPDGGANWQVVDGPSDATFAANSRRNIHVTAFPPNATLSATFSAYAGLGSTLLGAGTPGTGGIAPQLEGLGLPLQGSATTLQVGNAVGGSIGVLGLSFDPPNPTTFLGADLWLSNQAVLLSLTTSGTNGQAGVGSFGLPVAIPVAANLIGESFVSQAMILDPGSATGFTVTNGLETWLR